MTTKEEAAAANMTSRTAGGPGGVSVTINNKAANKEGVSGVNSGKEIAKGKSSKTVDAKDKSKARASISSQDQLTKHGNAQAQDDDGFAELDLNFNSNNNNNLDEPGKLRMNDVKNLPEDADQVIDQLKGVDLVMQDLDVLIELSKQLKTKREALFPDVASILMSDVF